MGSPGGWAGIRRRLAVVGRLASSFGPLQRRDCASLPKADAEGSLIWILALVAECAHQLTKTCTLLARYRKPTGFRHRPTLFVSILSTCEAATYYPYLPYLPTYLPYLFVPTSHTWTDCTNQSV
jgi:hypothetical protein